MEASHFSSDVDPSSVLGFGSALAMLDSVEEVARLLTGTVRSMGLADLQAVILTSPSSEGPDVFGSMTTRELPEPVRRELQALPEHVSLENDGIGAPARQQIDVGTETDPALAERGLRQLSVICLGTADEEFGLLVAGHTAEGPPSSVQWSSLQMLAAQASMAIHRIHLDRQRRSKEAALRESEARYRELYENAPVAYVSATPDGEIRMVNEQATALLGADRETLIGRSMPKLCMPTPAGSGDGTAERLERHLQDGGPIRDDEVQLCRVDGEQVWVSLTMRPLEHPDDGAERLVMMIDVTERKRMETALREARDDLEARVERRTAELEKANARLRRQTKRLEALRDVDRAILAAESPREIATVAARRAQDLVPCERVSVALFDWSAGRVSVLTAQQTEGSMLETGTDFPIDQFTLNDRLRSGKIDEMPHFDEVPSTPITDRLREAGIRSAITVPMIVEGELIGTVNLGSTEEAAFCEEERRIGRELSDHLAIALRQARLLEEVQAQREELEERVEERTAELESFTYSVSHDLRTPLRAIDGYARILREDHADQLDDEGQRLLDVVYDSAQKMGDLIDDLLTLSRVGRREMTRVRIDMAALVHEVHDELCRSYPEIEDVRCEIHDLPPALGDRSMIRQVFTNLLSNALKFTRDEDEPRIEIGAQSDTDTVTFFVRDNGVGFDMQYVDKLFGVFERLHDDEDFEGTGVGLAVVERIIQRHGGRVWGEAAEGDGATISFTLPNPTTGPDE